MQPGRNSPASLPPEPEDDAGQKNGWQGFEKVYVMRNREWVETKEDITLDNGIVVYKTGKVKKGEKEIELKEGEMVNKTGDFFDRTGNAVANAWDDTKDAVKDAGEAVGDAAKKVGKKVDSVATGKHRE